VILPEHAGAALPRDLDRLFTQDRADESGHAGILGMEPVRSDVEMKIPVVEGSSEPADDPVAFDDRYRVASARELISDGETGYAGPDYAN
jgi:hypothetical protein